MDYNKLKTFITVVEHQSITSAAQTLRRSQSAISQQIQSLEQELGLLLLERKNARIFLSHDGEALYRESKNRVSEIDDAVFTLQGKKTNAAGHIRLSELDDFGNQFQLGEFLAKFCEQYPRITFDLKRGTSPQIESDLLENEVDLGFSVYFSHPEMFHQIPIEKTWHSLYTSRTYLERVGPLDSFKKILACDLIDLDEKFICLKTFFEKNHKPLAPSILHQKPSVVVSNHLCAKQIVSSGHGVAILPDYFVTKEIKTGKLIKLMPRSKSVYAGLDLVYRTHKTLRLCEKLFINYIKASTKK